jgi:hypothetical protein
VAPLAGDALELVDGDELAAPGHLDRLEAADAERLRGLGAGVARRTTKSAFTTTT